MPFEAMWKDLEIVTLSKWVRRRKINIWHHLYLESLSKMVQVSLFIKLK